MKKATFIVLVVLLVLIGAYFSYRYTQKVSVQETEKADQSVPVTVRSGPAVVITEYKDTPSMGFMGGVETKYVFYSDGTIKHYQQGKEVMNYEITLTSDELDRLEKSPTDKEVLQNVVNAVYRRELDAWEKQKQNL